MNKFMENNKKNFIMIKKFSETDSIFRLIDIELSKKGWNRKKLAQALNKTESWLSNIMNKRRGLSAQTILDIANALQINPASLLPGNNPTIKPEFEEYIKSIMKNDIEEIRNDIKEIKNMLKPK